MANYHPPTLNHQSPQPPTANRPPLPTAWVQVHKAKAEVRELQAQLMQRHLSAVMTARQAAKEAAAAAGLEAPDDSASGEDDGEEGGSEEEGADEEGGGAGPSGKAAAGEAGGGEEEPEPEPAATREGPGAEGEDDFHATAGEALGLAFGLWAGARCRGAVVPYAPCCGGCSM